MLMVEENPFLEIKDTVDDDGDPDAAVLSDGLASEGKPVQLLGNVGSFVDRLDEEFRKSLQNIDPHSQEFIERLKDEAGLYGLIVRTQSHYIKTKQQNELVYSLVLLRRVEHIYFKVCIWLIDAHEISRVRHILSSSLLKLP